MSQKHEQMIDWKYMRTYDSLVAEYQIVGYENSVSIVSYCKDMELFFIHKFADWFFDFHNKLIYQSAIHAKRNHIQIFNGYVNVCVAGL